MSYDKIFDITAAVLYYFHNILDIPFVRALYHTAAEHTTYGELHAARQKQHSRFMRTKLQTHFGSCVVHAVCCYHSTGGEMTITSKTNEEQPYHRFCMAAARIPLSWLGGVPLGGNSV